MEGLAGGSLEWRHHGPGDVWLSPLILGKLEGTVDSQGAGLGLHVDELDFQTAKIVGGGQVMCLERLLWADYPALLGVLEADVKFNPTRTTQLVFNHSDVPVGFYRVTDGKLRPRLNGKDAGETEIWVRSRVAARAE